MAQYPEPPRPQMKRKSSAQNLLTSFKTASSSPGTTSGSQTPSIVSSSNTLVYQQMATTPVPTTPMAREWDAQSLPPDPTSNSSGQQGTSVEYLRDLVLKRIITLNYIRSIHEGRSHWFHTILISRSELDREFNNHDMKKRTYRFSMLGMSLSTWLDIHQPQDLLRGLLNTLSEFEQSKEDNDKLKMRPPKRLFRTKTGKRQGLPEYGGHADDGYLAAPQVGFPLDYHETLLSLLDVLSEVYNKISKFLGPSPFPHSSQTMMGPLGLLAPHPGVSYLFSGEGAQNTHPYLNPSNANSGHYSTPSLNQPQFTSETDLNSSLWGIANATMTGGNLFMGGGLTSPPTPWTPSFGDMLLKIDGKFKKITSTLLKELDQFARNGIKDELASLDPLLRNIDIPEESGGKSIYEFDGM